MEQLTFQQKWFYLAENQLLTTGQRVLWTWTVPQDESWVIDILMFVNGDTVPADVRVRIVAANQADGVGDVINKEFQPGFETLLYPARNLQNNVATSIGMEFIPVDGFVLLPREKLEIVTSNTESVPNITHKLRGRYKLRPIPVLAAQLGPVRAVPTVV